MIVAKFANPMLSVKRWYLGELIGVVIHSVIIKREAAQALINDSTADMKYGLGIK